MVLSISTIISGPCSHGSLWTPSLPSSTIGVSPTLRAWHLPLPWEATLSPHQPPALEVSPGACSWWSLFHVVSVHSSSSELECELLDSQVISRSGIFWRGPAWGEHSPQQHLVKLYRCCQEKTPWKPGPLTGETAWGGEGQAPLPFPAGSVHSQTTRCLPFWTCISLKARRMPIGALKFHLPMQEGCRWHRHHSHKAWGSPGLPNFLTWASSQLLPEKHTCR